MKTRIGFFLAMWLAAMCSALSVACTKVATQGGHGNGNPWTIPGVLRLGVRNEPDNLDPILAQQQIDVDLSMFWAGYLFEYDDAGHFVPDLAATMPTLANGGVSPDGRTITYHLRPGVKWQDGAPFGADDVIYSWHAVMNGANPVASRVGYELIRSIKKIDDRTIAVRLSHAYAPFTSAFFTSVAAYAYCIVPAHLLPADANIAHAAYNLHPVGTGPYQVVEYQPDNLLRMVANPSYWRGPPALREVDVRVVPNDNTLATLLRTHEIDLYYRVPHFVSQGLRGQPGITVVSSAFTRFADIGFNLTSPILSDHRVRQAIAYATDKASIVQNVTAGRNIVAISDQPPFSWVFDPNVPRYDYDPAQAKSLLEAAGWHAGPDGVRRKDGQPLRVGLAGIAGDATLSRAEALLQSQWRAAGILTDIKLYPSNILYASMPEGGIETTGHFDTVLESFANGVDPDDSDLFECRFRPPNGENVYRLCDPQLDTDEEEALSTLNPARRKALYQRIQQIEAQELPILPIWFERYDYAFNSDLRNFRPSHVGTPFWNAWQWRL